MRLPIGRDIHINWAVANIGTNAPVEFNAPCGFGKTTLLRYLAERLGHETGRPVVYLVAGWQHPSDLLHQIAERFGGPGGLPRWRPIVAVDDLDGSDQQVTVLMEALRDCTVIVGAERRRLDYPGRSVTLPGLSGGAACTLVADDLGRSLTADEAATVRRLATALHGNPLHLRQAAALVRAGEASLADLARAPRTLDEMSRGRLSGPARRAVQTLALLAGAFLPADLVAALSDLDQATEALRELRTAHIVEQDTGSGSDRFMLPVCRATAYRTLAMQYLDLGEATRIIAHWLAGQDPQADTTLDVAGAALTLADELAERREWTSVLAVTRALEPIMRLAGRMQAWQHLVDLGVTASHEIGALVSEAHFTRQRDGDSQTAGTSPRRWPNLGRPVAVLAGVVAVVIAVGVLRAGADGGIDIVAEPTSTPTPGPRSTTGPPSSPPKPPGPTVTSSPPGPVVEAPSVNPDRRDFGKQAVGVATRWTFTITNPNHQTLTVNDVRVEGESFAIGAQRCRGQRLRPTATCEVTVVFRPNAAGPQQGQLTIIDRQGHRSAATLAGKGIAILTIRVVDLKGNNTQDIGTVKDDRGLVNCTNICRVTIDDPTKTDVRLTEVPPPFHGPDGIVFIEWRGACTGSAATCPVTVGKNVTVTAVFNFIVG
jgi:hypothetical protein